MEVHVKQNVLTSKMTAHDKQIINSDGVLPMGSRIMFFVSPKGGGKTSLYLSLLTAKESPYFKYFDHIFMINPSGMHDKKIKDFYEELDEDGRFYDQLTEANAVDIKTKLQAISDSWKKKRPVQNLLIIDDSSGDFPSGRKKSAITQLFTNSRHLGVSIWLITHKFNNVPPIWRNQVDSLFLFKTNSKLEVETLKRDLNVDEDFFEACLRDATSKPFGFLFVNMSNGSPRLFRKFDEYVMVEDD